MESLITDAIVLRVVDYAEADRVATLMTRGAGMVTALARGARRSRKRFAALQLFSSGQACVRERRGEMWALEGFEMARGFSHLGLDIAKVAHGAYVCELTRELCPPHHAEPRIFELLHQFLDLLDGGAADTVRLRVYELALLDAVGLSPSLDRCVGCGAEAGSLPTTDDDGGQLLDTRRGGLLCASCSVGQGHAAHRRPLPEPVRRALCSAQGAGLAKDDRPAVTQKTWDDARDALQAILLEHLGRPLRSTEFIAKLNAAR